jgi:exopolyphosphatase/guanosine-5'-triphosphate,3'-diphosphate pyrophosphatase
VDTLQVTNEWVALVDIGSNAVRCVVARLDANPGVEVTFRRRVQTRLGASASDELPKAGVQATLRTTKRFLEEVTRNCQQARLLCVATAAVRDAKNRDALLAPLGELGVREVRILSGSEEGQLGAEAALRALPIEDGVIIDLGGGSLQSTPVEGGVLQGSQSVPLGVARLSRRFLGSDPATPAELDALRAEVRAQLQPLLRPRSEGDRVLTSGGTVHALARLALSRREPEGDPQATHGYVLSREELGAMRAWLEPLSREQLGNAPGIQPERADVILAGAIVLEEYLALSGFSELTASRTSVREGVLWREAMALTG